MTRSLRIEHGGHSLELLGCGAIRWESTLLVADLHLGKETVFQKSGIAIPSGATQRTLSRLEGLVRDWEGVCDRLVVLGDLLHAPTGWTDELEGAFQGLMERHSSLQWKLVAGNHDRRSHELEVSGRRSLVICILVIACRSMRGERCAQLVFGLARS